MIQVNALRHGVLYDFDMQELDVRPIPPRDKHPTIHRLLDSLPNGDTLRLINDHDPRPLRFELEADYPAAFAWEYLERGPEVWRVDIRKVGAPSDPVVLDVRPYHARGEEPYEAIMRAADELPQGRSLLLINSFEPVPLFRAMERKGFTTHSCTRVSPDEVHVVFIRRVS
jgi:uncharacterized protein (DUF2249 family)